MILQMHGARADEERNKCHSREQSKKREREREREREKGELALIRMLMTLT